MALHNLSTLSTDTILCNIEKSLINDDKISLLFLLIDTPQLALQYSALQTTSFLQDWSHQPDNPKWHDKLQEALCIIGCYKMLKFFNIERKEADDRYLPHTFESSLNIDPMRKSLYLLCEELTLEECAQLVKLIQPEDEYTSYEHINLELMLLDWFSNEIITSTNVDPIIKALKKINKKTMADNLTETVKIVQRTQAKRTNVLYRPLENNTIYSTDSTNMGLCIIINQKCFHYINNISQTSSPLPTRIGTDIDRDRLQETFLMFGLEVVIWEDCNKEDMLSKLEKTSHDFKQDHCMLVVCVLSHGEKDLVYCADSTCISIDEIARFFYGQNCQALIGKPKVFCIQACQGNDAQMVVQQTNLPVSDHRKDIASDAPYSSELIPNQADYIIFHSTVSGFVSFRDLLKGTFFIDALCSTLVLKSQRIHLTDVFVEVIRNASSRVVPIENKKCSMIPTFKTTLRSSFKLEYSAKGVVKATRLRMERFLFKQLLEEFLQVYCLKQG